MTGVQLTRALERGRIANENFHHASHLHVAWVYLLESSSVDEAAGKMRNTLRRFATSAGKPEKYHETITLFWVHFLSRARATTERECLEEIVHANPRLLPTDLLVPSVFDIHPDHNALGVMIRLVLGESLSVEPAMSVWAYAVHGKSRAFFGRARLIGQSDIETAVKLRAIGCHKTQLKLSRKRFLRYAGRPERFVKLDRFGKIITDGSIDSISREGQSLQVELRLSPKVLHTTDPALFVLGHHKSGVLRCARMQIPVRSSRPELLDCSNLERVAIAQYHGGAFGGELAIPIDMFSTAHALFVKLRARSWFFDEAGWLEVTSAGDSAVMPSQMLSIKEDRPKSQFRKREFFTRLYTFRQSLYISAKLLRVKKRLAGQQWRKRTPSQAP